MKGTSRSISTPVVIMQFCAAQKGHQNGQHVQKVAGALAPLVVSTLVGVGRCQHPKVSLDADGHGHTDLEGSGTRCPSAPLTGDCCN